MEPKALPPAKISAIKLFNKSSLAIKPKKIDVSSLKKDGPQSDVLVIKKQVIKIKDLIATNTLLKAKEEERKRKESEKKRFAGKEEKLEKPKDEGIDKVKLPAAPRLSFLDRIKKFLFNVLLGFVVYRLIPHLPKLMGVAKLAGQALDFVTDWGGKLLNGLVTFVDWGYKAYDGTKAFLKGLGGENFTKVFDGFIGAMDKVIEASIIAAIAFSELGSDDFGPDVKKSGRKISADVGKRGLGRAGTRLALRTFGRGGSKLVLKFVRPFLKRLPIIGALIDFGLSVALGENPGRAAFKAVGAGLLGSIGAAVGAIGGPASIAGGILGGLAGDWIGGSLYDLFFGQKEPQKTKVQGRAQGGSVTRGGKFVGGPAKREIKKDAPKREVSIIPPKLKPGSSVGGDKEIQKVFPKSDKPDTVSPLRYTEKFYEKSTDIPFFGPIFGVATKILLGDKPSSLDYDNIGKGLNSWMNNTFSGEVLRTGGAFAGGGEVNAEMFMAGEDLTKVIAKSVEESISTKLDDVINDLMREMMLKPSSRPAGVPGPAAPDAMDTINIQGGDADFWTLVAVASREDGEPQAWADVAQSIYNRLASGAYSGKTIKDLIVGQMQYEPTWRYPKSGVTGKPNPEWYQIKDAASAGAAAGQSEDAMKKVAAALLDPTLQKNAREFVQGRTDFRGYSVSGGIQRKSGDNYFGWYNNYQANKIGSVPNFGATASTTGPGPGMVGPLGAGKVGAVDQFNSIAQKFGLQLTSDYRPGDSGYHGKNRARDYSNDGVGRGTPQQLAFAKYLVENYGSSLTQLIYTPLGFGIANGKKVGLDYWGSSVNANHYHHVHVALAKGGLVRGFTRAIIGEKGPEFVIDADSTAALEQNFPGFLGALNKANYDGAIQVLRNYASYEFGSGIEVVVEQPEPEVVPVMMPIPMGGDSFGSSYSDGETFDGLYNRG
jgi:Cell Wall Hydrolase